MKLRKYICLPIIMGLTTVVLTACGDGSSGSAEVSSNDPSPVAEIPVSNSDPSPNPGNEAAVEMEFNPFVKQLVQLDLDNENQEELLPEEMNTQVWVFDDSEEYFSDLYEE